MLENTLPTASSGLIFIDSLSKILAEDCLGLPPQQPCQEEALPTTLLSLRERAHQAPYNSSSENQAKKSLLKVYSYCPVLFLGINPLVMELLGQTIHNAHGAGFDTSQLRTDKTALRALPFPNSPVHHQGPSDESVTRPDKQALPLSVPPLLPRKEPPLDLAQVLEFLSTRLGTFVPLPPRAQVLLCSPLPALGWAGPAAKAARLRTHPGLCAGVQSRGPRGPGGTQ